MNSSRSKSRSRRSSASNASPELSIDDVSLLDDEENEKVSINSDKEQKQEDIDHKANQSPSNS